MGRPIEMNEVRAALAGESEGRAPMTTELTTVQRDQASQEEHERNR